MSKLTKKTNRYGRTDSNFRKTSLLTIETNVEIFKAKICLEKKSYKNTLLPKHMKKELILQTKTI